MSRPKTRTIQDIEADIAKLEQEKNALAARDCESRQKDPAYVPKVGDDIYVNSAYYIDHGEDDVVGGLAKVKHIAREYGGIWIHVHEHPGRGVNWEYLKGMQAELKKEFGDKRAYPCPDNG